MTTIQVCKKHYLEAKRHYKDVAYVPKWKELGRSELITCMYPECTNTTTVITHGSIHVMQDMHFDIVQDWKTMMSSFVEPIIMKFIQSKTQSYVRHVMLGPKKEQFTMLNQCQLTLGTVQQYVL